MERPIPIVWLPERAQFPLGQHGVVPTHSGAETYRPFTLLPSSEAEHEALRCWVTTHQSMFFTIGAAAGILSRAIELLELGWLGEAVEFMTLSAKLRRASAVYTFLPALDRPIYEAYLRPAMTGVRPAFSGVSSRESIEFAILIKRLREMPLEAAEMESARAESLESDRIWWQCHVGAMQRMVGNPISLAQHEFKRQKGEGLESSYSEFLATTLQVTDALDDYDRFFACRREVMDEESYLLSLKNSLLISDEYISDEEPFASYRAELSEAIQEMAKFSNMATR